MATVTLMRYTGLPQVINKNTTTLASYSGSFTQPLSLMNPTIEFTGNSPQTHFVNNECTYVFANGKYYYVMDYELTHQNHLKVNLHMDVLMTYKSEVNALNVMLDRSSSAPNGDLPDNLLPLSASHGYEKIELPHSFNENKSDGAYVLVTSQNGYTPV